MAVIDDTMVIQITPALPFLESMKYGLELLLKLTQSRMRYVINPVSLVREYGQLDVGLVQQV